MKRLARYLGVRPRGGKNVSPVSNPGVTRILLGCIRSRKSVSGCALMLGNSTVCTHCKGSSRDRTQFGRSGVLWVGECNVANVGTPEYSLALGMEM